MEYRFLGGRTGLRVSEIALGTGRLGTGADSGPDEASSVLQAYAEAGGNFVDVASAYQFGRAEEVVGEFLARAGRDNFVVASKFGRTASREPSKASVGNHRKAMLAEVEGSLRRLGTDRIDLYFAHLDDGITPVDELMRGFENLVDAGKIVHVGLSNFPAWRAASAAMLADLRGWAPVAVLQFQYNLLERTADREHLPLAAARGLGLMAWAPLAGGRLGKPRQEGQAPPSGPGRVSGMTDDSVLEALHEVAAELGSEPATVALAWLIRKGPTPIIGPRTRAQLAANLAAAEVRLPDPLFHRLDEASRPHLGYPYDLLAQVREGMGLSSGRSGLVL